MKACNSCGKCCIKYSNGALSASEQDLATWESLRPEIYRYVRDGKIWMDPETGKQIDLCPWLRPMRSSKKLGNKESQLTYSCAIYFDRPEDCRIYPATIDDMLKDECEMLEPSDLHDTKKAAKELANRFSDD